MNIICFCRVTEKFNEEVTVQQKEFTQKSNRDFVSVHFFACRFIIDKVPLLALSVSVCGFDFEE